VTVLEFEAWVSDHYKELLKVGRAMSKKRGYSYDASADVVHQVIETTLENPERLATIASDARGPMVWTWMTSRLQGYMTASIMASRTRSAALESFGGELGALGADVYADMGHGTELEKARRAREKREKRQRPQSPSTSCVASGVDVEWVDFPRDGKRWRKQQQRDNKAFDERAVRSLAESMHKASQAYRHFGEHGFAFSEFGQEASR